METVQNQKCRSKGQTHIALLLFQSVDCLETLRTQGVAFGLWTFRAFSPFLSQEFDIFITKKYII